MREGWYLCFCVYVCVREGKGRLCVFSCGRVCLRAWARINNSAQFNLNLKLWSVRYSQSPRFGLDNSPDLGLVKIVARTSVNVNDCVGNYVCVCVCACVCVYVCVFVCVCVCV